MEIRREHGYFPFLNSSKKAIETLGLGTELDEKLLRAAEQRVYSAVMHRKLSLPNYFRVDDIILDIKAYALSRVIVSVLGKRMEWYIDAESNRALEICHETKCEDWLMSELGISVSSTGEVPLNVYLRFGTSFPVMGLSNRKVSNGYVQIESHERTVLLKEAIRKKISEGLPIKETLISDDIKKRISSIVSNLSSEIALKSPSLGRQSKDIAPCMQKVLDDLGSGANVPHIKRWALGVFLVKRGWDIGRIVNVFSHAPNFNEKTTEYQLQHIKSKGYSMPSCANLKSQGICVADCGIKNPLQYKLQKDAKT